MPDFAVIGGDLIEIAIHKEGSTPTALIIEWKVDNGARKGQVVIDTTVAPATVPAPKPDERSKAPEVKAPRDDVPTVTITNPRLAKLASLI